MTALTGHAAARLRQRGLRDRDVDFILRHGTDTGDGAILAGKDVQRLIKDAKRIIDNAQRLKNKRVVALGGTVITVFHADRRQQHELLHK
jgi:hypothetical protein